MANREACELWIEQEIESGLEKGKKPYSIGKELSAMIERLFETKIKSTTIEKRAERQREKLPTNVGNNSKGTVNSDYRQSDEQKPRLESGRGGKRKNAGRPTKPRSVKQPAKYTIEDQVGCGVENETTTSPNFEVAMKYARMAVAQLEQVRDFHHDWDEAFNFVETWIYNERKKMHGKTNNVKYGL